MPVSEMAEALWALIGLMLTGVLVLIVVPMTLKSALLYNMLRLRMKAAATLSDKAIGTGYRVLLVTLLERAVKEENHTGCSLMATVLIRDSLLSSVKRLKRFERCDDYKEAGKITLEFYKCYMRYLYLTSPILAAFIHHRLPAPKHDSLLAAMRLSYSMDDSWKGR